VHAPEALVPATRTSGEVVVTRPEREWNKRVRCIGHLQKAVSNPCFWKQRATLVKFILCWQMIFAPQKFLSSNFIHIFADDQISFLPSFRLW